MALRMSELTKLWIFVEGKHSDRYFYSKIAAPVCDTYRIGYKVVGAYEIPKLGSGKKALRGLHKYLSDNNLLVLDAAGKKTAVVMFLDKDIDELVGQRIESDHITYTGAYDVEGELFSLGNIAEAAAAAGCCDENTLTTAFGDCHAWRRKCAERWKDWIKVCIFCERHNALGQANYGVPSPLNTGLTGPVDTALLENKLNAIRGAAGMDADEFKRRFGAVSRFVELVFKAERFDAIFKGKWYRLFLSSDMTALLGNAFDKPALDGGIIGVLSRSMDFAGEWTGRYRMMIEKVCQQL